MTLGAMLDWKRLFGGRKPVLADAAGPAEDPAETLQESLRCYLAVLAGVAEHAPDTLKQLKEDYGHHLRKIRDDLSGSTPTARLLHDSERRVQAQLKGYGKGIDRHIQQQQKDAREVVALMASMAESIGSQEKQYHVRFKGIAKKLRLLTTTGDLSEIRQRLSEEVTQLEKYAEDMTRDTRVALERVNTNLAALRERQNPTPWLEREPDPVTHIPGRPVGREAIETRQNAGTSFAIARFAVKQFSAVTERHKPAELGLALAEFATHIKEEVKDIAAIFRWSESEFVAVFDCHLAELAGKLSLAENKLTATYRGVPITCTASAVQPFRGETLEQLIVRLETAALESVAT